MPRALLQTPDADVMRCKLYAILLPAYTILGMEEEAAKLVGGSFYVAETGIPFNSFFVFYLLILSIS